MSRKEQLRRRTTQEPSQHGESPYRRSAVANRRLFCLRDRYEQQADDVTARILRGDQGVSRLLTPAPSASLREPSSPGDALPTSLREELEVAFGADLSAVRVHRDSVAAAATAREHAIAFASGRDIYFGAGRYEPASPGGRRLLIHELAHVLQQTGRASSQGRLAATPHRASGPIQRKTEIPDFETLRKLHAPKNAAGEEKFAAVADALAKRVAEADPKAALDAFFASSLPQIKDWPAEAEGLFYDVLKRFERFELAAQLIERDDFKGGTRIRTAAWTGDLVAALEQRNKGQEVYPIAAEKHPVLAFYVDELVRLIEVFIFGPLDAPIPQMLRYGVKEDDAKPQTIFDHLKDLSERLEDNTKLSSNEWVFNALYTIQSVDQLRRSKCVEIFNTAQAEAEKAKEGSQFRKRRLAEGVRQWGETFLESTANVFPATDADAAEKQAAWKPLLKKIGARVAKTGRDAILNWDRTQAIDEAMTAYDKAVFDDDAKAIDAAVKGLARVREVGERVGLPAKLIHMLSELNRPGASKESPPDVDEYRQRARDLAEALKQFSVEKLEKPQPKLFHERKTDEEAAYIWLTLWVARLASNLRWMAAGPTDNPNVGLIDERIVKRLQRAYQIKHLAKPLDWTRVVQAADVILRAEAEQESQLGILPFPDGKFWHQDKAPIEDLGKDLRGIETWEPLEGRHLALLFRTAYYEALASKINDLTPASDADEKRLVDAGTLIPFVAGRADKEIQALPHPERWSVNQSEVAWKGKKNERFLDLIARHHSFDELKDHATPRGLIWLLPALPGHGVFSWLTPPIETVIPTLRRIDLLNAQVALTLPGKGKPADKVELTKRLDDAVWFKRLTVRMASQLDPEQNLMTAEERQVFLGALTDALSAEQSAAWDDVVEKIKRSSRLDRQLTAKLILPHLERYEDDHHLYGEPPKALEPIIRFFVAVSMLEDADVDAEMTALMLEIAPRLESAFEYESRFDIVHSYLGFMESAVKFLPTFEAMTPVKRGVFLPSYQNSEAWIKPRTESLRAITAHFQSVRESVQKGEGYKASLSGQELISFMKFSSPIPAGTLLVPRDGGLAAPPNDQRYRVTKILRDFIFHPAYGYPQDQAAGTKKKKKSTLTGGSKIQILQTDDKTPLVLKPGEKLLEVAILDKKNQVVAVKQIGPEDTELLEDIHNGLSWAAFGSAMGNINAAIEWYANTLLDLAEFIPGVGQGIAAARIIATIALFWAEGDYEEVKALVSSEIRSVVEGLLGRVKDAADPENLIRLLFFGDERLDHLLAHSNVGKTTTPKSKTPPPTPASTGKFARVGRVLRGFRRLGHGLFVGIRKLHDSIQVPMEDFRAYASSRPLLSFALRFAADRVATIVDLAKKGAAILGMGDADDQSKGVTADLKTSLKEQQVEFGVRLHDALKKLEELKLPQTVLHIEPLVSFVLQMLEGFLIKRLGLKAKVTFLLLEKTGALSFFNDRVAKEIVEAGVDPNIYWREQIVPAIVERFNEARDSVVQETNRLLAQPAFDGVFDPVAKAPPLTLTTEGEPFTETAEDDEPAADATASPAPSPDRPMRSRPARLPAFGAGQRLDPQLRNSLEVAFGQDFSHVRVHGDGESEAMTEAFGVDGLTTGSHIFVRPSLSLESDRGETVLHHELAHVVQQTGSRPPGESAPQPITGHPERGLDFDPVREQAADRVAAVVSARSAPKPADFGDASGAGLQPTGVSLFTIANLLHSVTDLAAIKKREETLDLIQTETKLPAAAKSTVEKTLAILKNLQGNLAIVKRPNVFKDAIPLVHNRLADNRYAEPIRFATFEIAREALVDLPLPKAAKGTTAPQASKADQVVNPSHFARQVESYVLAKTGIALGLALKTKKVPAPSGAQVETVDDQDPVKDIKILHIHLPYIDGRSPLWTNAINNTWASADEKQRAKVRAFVRPLLEGKGVVVGIWALSGDKYQFSFAFKREVDELVKASVTGKALDPKDLPAWADYVQTSKDLSSPIGVRIATYQHGSQKGAGRHSHHLTQFLLADYFANTNKGAQPFRKGRDYPGVEWEGEAVKSIARTPNSNSTNLSIQVLKTKGTGRGDEMPTVSLAASTHMGGNLHITPQADDLGGSTKKTQAGSVHNEFMAHLPEGLKTSNDAIFNKYKKEHSDTDVAETIYLAAQRTYKAIEKHMGDALRDRMPQLEFDYYTALAEGTANDLRDPTKPDVKTVAEGQFLAALKAVTPVARKHNEDTMRDDFGWKLKVS